MTTNHFFEVIVRYAEFFKENENFLATVINWFFSSHGIRNPIKAIASQAVNLFLRLTEKFRHLPIFPPQSQVIAQHLMSLIAECESGQISAEILGISEV